MLLNKNSYFFLLFFSLFLSEIAFSQENYSLETIFVPEKPENSYIQKEIKGNLQNKFKSKEARLSYLKSYLLELFENGYITANYDSLVQDSLTLRAYLHCGEKYILQSLSKGNVSDEIMLQSGVNKLIQKKENFSEKQLHKIFEKLIQYMENNGYPFAEISLDSLQMDNNKVYASLKLNPQKKIFIDSLVFKNKLNIAPSFIYHLIGIKAGALYNEKQINAISKRIKESQFLKEIKPTETGFFKSKATLYLYLDKQKNNQFDGILGFLPNNETGRLMITGDIRLKLMNVFGRGEQMDLNWRKLEASSQDLKLGFNYPFVLNSPFGMDLTFNLYKKDTLYLNTNFQLGIQYLFSFNHWIKAVYQNRSSNTLSNSNFENATQLPAYLDFSTDLYGLEYSLSTLDYFFNPQSGILLTMSGKGGIRNIKKRPSLNLSLYDHIQLQSSVYEGKFDLSIFQPLFRNTTLLFRSLSAKTFSNNILENEQFRIGGLKTLKGFDEESITASLYSIANLEFRYILDANSYLGIYWNGAYYEGKNLSVFKHDLPWGVGVGISFDTRSGIFSVYYALGADKSSSLQFKNSKIHFGLVSLF